MDRTILVQNARYLVDGSGQKQAVVLDYDLWEMLLTYLEDVEDIEDMKRLSGETPLPWEQAKAALRVEGVDV